ncbi:MAG: ribulose-phosphate 3-epimerase [Spirochaetaceae bacterium]|nr:ribulose-phosphate 3-epimerase [Spirochaetaceae bacterium]
MSINRKIQISVSILGADLSNVDKAVKLCEASGVDAIHVDVMDGHFVPQITFGNKFLTDLKKITKLPTDVHLMVNNPDRFIDDYLKAGADAISFHIEADIHVNKTLSSIKDGGAKAGICIIPSTPVAALSEIIDIVDFVQVMTVNPGFAGQKIIHSAIRKIGELDAIRKTKNLSFEISVDGGVNSQTSGEIIKLGADILITASAFFNANDPKKEAMIIRSGGAI